MGHFGVGRTNNYVARRAVLRALFIVYLFAAVLFVAMVPVDRLPLPQWLLLKIRKEEVIIPAKPVTVVKSEVLVANEIIPVGKKLRPAMFRTELRQVNGIEDQIITQFAVLKDQYAASAIPTDTILVKELMSRTSPASAITSHIPEGYRAISIVVDAETGVEGWARPGARVDVVWTTTQRNKRIVTNLVENSEVLSVERSLETETPKDAAINGSAHVTLLVTLKDAQRIHLAKASGTLSLSLRGDNDDKHSQSETVTMDNLLRPLMGVSKDGVEGTIKVGKDEFVLVAGKMMTADEFEGVRGKSEVTGRFGGSARAQLRIDH